MVLINYWFRLEFVLVSIMLWKEIPSRLLFYRRNLTNVHAASTLRFATHVPNNKLLSGFHA